MFYAYDLLCRQKRGKFSCVWYAAMHRKKLKQSDIVNVNIEETCEAILEAIQPHTIHGSRFVETRFSLYLSSNLLYGACIIYEHQTLLLFDELNQYQEQLFLTSLETELPVITKDSKKQHLKDDIDKIKKIKKITKAAIFESILISPMIPELDYQLDHDLNVRDQRSVTLQDVLPLFPDQQEFGRRDLGLSADKKISPASKRLTEEAPLSTYIEEQIPEKLLLAVSVQDETMKSLIPEYSIEEEVHPIEQQIKDPSIRPQLIPELQTHKISGKVPTETSKELQIPLEIDIKQVSPEIEIQQQIMPAMDIQQRIPPKVGIQEQVPPDTDMQQVLLETDMQQKRLLETDIQQVLLEIDMQQDLLATDKQQQVSLETDMQQQVLQETDMQQQVLQETDMQQQVLQETDMQQQVLQETDMQQQVLQETDMQQQVLQETDMQQQVLQETDMQQKLLLETDMQQKLLKETDIQQVLLEIDMQQDLLETDIQKDLPQTDIQKDLPETDKQQQVLLETDMQQLPSPEIDIQQAPTVTAAEKRKTMTSPTHTVPVKRRKKPVVTQFKKTTIANWMSKYYLHQRVSNPLHELVNINVHGRASYLLKNPAPPYFGKPLREMFQSCFKSDVYSHTTSDLQEFIMESPVEELRRDSVSLESISIGSGFGLSPIRREQELIRLEERESKGEQLMEQEQIIVERMAPGSIKLGPMAPGPIELGPMEPEQYISEIQMEQEKIIVEHMAPGPMAPEPMAPGPMAPEPMTPGPMAPGPMAPEPMAPEPMAPEPMAPEPMAPGPMTPGLIEPGPMEPGPMEPEQYISELQVPKPISPKTRESEQIIEEAREPVETVPELVMYETTSKKADVSKDLPVVTPIEEIHLLTGIEEPVSKTIEVIEVPLEHHRPSVMDQLERNSRNVLSKIHEFHNEDEMCTFDMLCPPECTTKATAAKVFYYILVLVRQKKITLKQDKTIPFGTISIYIR